MKNIFLKLIFFASAASEFPIARAQNDEFFQQQWALTARGQTFVRDLDDIRSERVSVASGTDIGWNKVSPQLQSLMKREPVVAVLDSGLDLEHPDIAARIYRNQAECTDKGLINPAAKDDKDGNGFVGDCMGWNFAAPGKGNARPYDTSGHGTHVAGIIAAIENNKIGITGVAPRVRILPVRVVDNSENSELPARTDIFARAIRYAADMNVDVINMSLGWPLNMQTPELKSAVEFALSKNITIVAAAGNNGHDNPVFPCAQRGVICVGALAPEGKLAEFSNYGGTVDLLAPGEFIYSLFPKSLRAISSGVQGYEIKTGTSQAAPFVSAAAAILRATIPGISNSEIRARLVSSARSIGSDNSKTPTLNGLLDLSGALTAVQRPVIEPVFKDLSLISYSKNDQNFSFTLPIRNDWAASQKRVSIALRVPDDTVEFSQSNFTFSSFSAFSESVLRITGQIANPQTHSEIPLAVDVVIEHEKPRTYRTTLFFSRNIESDGAVKRMKLPAVNGFPLSDAAGESLLRTVTDRFSQATHPEYFLSSAPTGILRVTLLRPNGHSFSATVPYEIPNGQRILNFVSVDTNHDGKRDYLIQSIVKNGQGSGMRFDWLDENFRPLFGARSVWTIEVEGAAISSQFAFLKFNDPDFGIISLPVFAEEGAVPKRDRFEDPFEPRSTQDIARHLYFINPTIINGTVVAQTRILDTNALRTKIGEQIGGASSRAVDIAGLMPQSLSDFQSGRLNAVLLSGSLGSRQAHVLTLEGYDSFKLAKLRLDGGENISSNRISPLRYLSGQSADFNAGGVLVSLFDPHRARTLTFHPKAFLSDSIQTRFSGEFDYQRGRRDHLLSGLGAYEDAAATYVFYQSKRKLLMQYITGGEVRNEFEAPLYRYSFIPGAVFNQMFYPVAYSTSAGRLPAFYTDNTAINRQSVQLMVASRQGMSRPINMAVTIPASCRSLNPARAGNSLDFHFVFHCGNELRLLPMGQ